MQNNAFNQNRTEYNVWPFERCSLQTISSCQQEKLGCGGLVTSHGEGKFQGDNTSGFQPECCLWKSQYRTISKKKSFKASVVYILPWEIEGSVPSGLPHALRVRFGMAARHLPDGVGAYSVPCQMSCCCLRGCHSYLPRVHAVSGVAECSPCLPQRNSWISENVPGLPLHGSPLFAWCILCTYQSLSSVGVLYMWLTLTKGWGPLYFFFFSKS